MLAPKSARAVRLFTGDTPTELAPALLVRSSKFCESCASTWRAPALTWRAGDASDPVEETLAVYRWHADGDVEVVIADRNPRIFAEPFDAIDLHVGVLFGNDDDE